MGSTSFPALIRRVRPRRRTVAGPPLLQYELFSHLVLVTALIVHSWHNGMRHLISAVGDNITVLDAVRLPGRGPLPQVTYKSLPTANRQWGNHAASEAGNSPTPAT